jgi:hypothetical protein
MADDFGSPLIATLLRLLFQALFDSAGACGIDGVKLKQEMLGKLQKWQNEAMAHGETGEAYALAMGVLLGDPELTRFLIALIKKELGRN